MEIICEVTRCRFNSAKEIIENNGKCLCNKIHLSHNSMDDKKNKVDCKEYENGFKPFGDYTDNY